MSSVTEGMKRLAKHYLEETNLIETRYANGQSNSMLIFGAVDTGNWNQIQWIYTWIIQNSSIDSELAVLCCRYPAVAPNLLNALQSPDDRLSWLDQALKQARRLGETEIERAHLGNMVLTCRTAGRLGRQLHYIQELAELYASDESGEAAAVLSMLGEAYRLSNQYPEAIQVLEQARRILEKHHHPLTTYTYHNLGITYRNLGDFEKSAHFHELEKDISEQEEDWLSFSRATLSLGIMYQEELEIGKALTNYDIAQKAIEKEEVSPSARNSYIFRLRPDSQQVEVTFGYSTENWQKFNKIPVLGNKGALEIQIGRYREAIHLLEEAIQLCQDLAQQRYEAIWLHKKGMAHLFLGEIEDASSCQNQSLAVAESIRAMRAVGFAYYGLGKAAIIQAELQRSSELLKIGVEYLVKAYDIASEAKNLRDMQDWGAELAEAYIFSGNYAEAERLLEPLLQIQVRENKYRISAIYGILSTFTSRPVTAFSMFESALQQANSLLQSGQPILIVHYVQSRLLCHLALLSNNENRAIHIQDAITKYKETVSLSPLAKGQMFWELFYFKSMRVHFPQYETLYLEIEDLIEKSIDDSN